MNQIIFTLILLADTTSPSYRRRPGLRVLYGVPDTKHKYSYVVALVSDISRRCTGTLLSPEWVLTAAHCLEDTNDIYIQYGNMTVFPNVTLMKSEVFEQVPHPGYRAETGKDDVALLRINPVLMPVYGRISTVDYVSLIGLAVEYAGYGTTEHENDEDDRRPLLIGEGVVRSCLDILEDEVYAGFLLCVAPKCSNKKADSANGDSGGPLFYDKKIIGIVSFGNTPIGIYTAVSPYIIWIRETMMADENRRQLSNSRVSQV